MHILKKKTSRLEKLENAMDEYQKTAEYLKNHPGVVGIVFLITCLQRVALFFVTYFVYRSFGLHQYSMRGYCNTSGYDFRGCGYAPAAWRYGNLRKAVFHAVYRDFRAGKGSGGTDPEPWTELLHRTIDQCSHDCSCAAVSW